jgi:hypothetical protein
MPHVQIPELTPQQEVEVYTELKKKYPNLTRQQLDQVLAGGNPYGRPEKESNGDVDKCLKIASDALAQAEKSANDIKNPVAKAIVLAGARLLFIFAEIQCYSDYGD